MPLLAPLFLLGLGAIAVPLLVHLVQKEKRDPTAFPSLMFLEKTPAPFTARRHLRHPLLLALRILALAALALAFARPVFGRRDAAGGVDQRRREVVVLVDRSFSMRIGTRWTRARAAVDSVIRTLGRGDRMTLVAFDRRAEALTDATGDVTVLSGALKTLALTDESTRLTPAITVAVQRFAASDAPRKQLVVVSDFQRSAWDLSDDVRLPAGAEVATLDVTDAAPVVDRSVRSVEVREDRRSGAPMVIVSARIANVGAAVRAVPVQLEVAGRVVETSLVDVPADGGASVTFAAIPLPPAPVPARVVLQADAIPGDDAQHLLLQQSPSLRTLVVESKPSVFLTRALGIGETPRFEVVTRAPGAVTAADLRAAALVILADGSLPTRLAPALPAFVRSGGGLVVALGAAFAPRAWQGELGTLLPGIPAAVRDADGAMGVVIGSVDERHPAMALLTGERSGDLGAARFLRYRSMENDAGVLARFDDGGAAITERAAGSGRVIAFASTLDGSWNDLPRQPAFLPLMQQLSQYAAGWRAPTRALEIGASIRPSDIAGVATAPRWVSTAPSGARTQVGGSGEAASLELREAGVHELRPGGQPGARPVLVAANIAPAELDFSTFDVTRLSTALAASSTARSVGSVRLEETPADREARQSSWWFLLAAVVLLLAAESVVAWRAGTTTPVTE